MTTNLLLALQDVESERPVLFVQRSDDDGKEDSARGDVAKDLADGNVGIRKEDVDAHAQILDPVLYSFRVVPVHLVHADDLDVVDFAARPSLMTLTSSEIEHGWGRGRGVSPAAAAVPSSVVSPSAAAAGSDVGAPSALSPEGGEVASEGADSAAFCCNFILL